MNISRKQYLASAAVAIGLLAIVGGVGYFFSKYQIETQNPVHLKIVKPIWIQKRVTQVNVYTTVNEVDAVSAVPLNPTEVYLCNKFGAAQCLMALRVIHYEDGSEQCDRFHQNSNSTTDYGLFQINSQHIGQVIAGHTITLAELVTCQGNVDDAYLLESTEGWGIWSTFALAK